MGPYVPHLGGTMILLFRIFLVCLLSCYLLSVPARAQLNIGNIVNEISRHAAERPTASIAPRMKSG